MEKEKENKIDLKAIPQNSCKIFNLEEKRVAVCHEPTGEFIFFELKPIQPIHTYEAGAKTSDVIQTENFTNVAVAVDKEKQE